VYGEFTPEMFGDTAFTLAHNNGPMFNKGMLYSNYSSEFKKILDVQRSGQIPQYLSEKVFIGDVVPTYMAEAVVVFPAELTGTVDWYKVEALGALGNYALLKKKQVLAGKGPQGLLKDVYQYGIHDSETVPIVKRKAA
jgi:hypothetical protein